MDVVLGRVAVEDHQLRARRHHGRRGARRCTPSGRRRARGPRSARPPASPCRPRCRAGRRSRSRARGRPAATFSALGRVVDAATLRVLRGHDRRDRRARRLEADGHADGSAVRDGHDAVVAGRGRSAAPSARPRGGRCWGAAGAGPRSEGAPGDAVGRRVRGRTPRARARRASTATVARASGPSVRRTRGRHRGRRRAAPRTSTGRARSAAPSPRPRTRDGRRRPTRERARRPRRGSERRDGRARGRHACAGSADGGTRGPSAAGVLLAVRAACPPEGRAAPWAAWAARSGRAGSA